MTLQSDKSQRVFAVTTAKATLGVVVLASVVLAGCGQSENRKELELRERELALREKQFALLEKGLSKNDSAGQKSVAAAATPREEAVAIAAPSKSYRFEEHSNLRSFWTDLQNAMTSKDKNAIARMMNFPFVDYNELAYGRDGLTSRTNADFLDRFDRIFPRCSYAEIARGSPDRVGEITNLEREAGVTHQFLLRGSCRDEQGLAPLGYDFGKVNGKYRLLGLLYSP